MGRNPGRTVSSRRRNVASVHHVGRPAEQLGALRDDDTDAGWRPVALCRDDRRSWTLLGRHLANSRSLVGAAGPQRHDPADESGEWPYTPSVHGDGHWTRAMGTRFLDSHRRVGRSSEQQRLQRARVLGGVRTSHDADRHGRRTRNVRRRPLATRRHAHRASFRSGSRPLRDWSGHREPHALGRHERGTRSLRPEPVDPHRQVQWSSRQRSSLHLRGQRGERPTRTLGRDLWRRRAPLERRVVVVDDPGWPAVERCADDPRNAR